MQGAAPDVRCFDGLVGLDVPPQNRAVGNQIPVEVGFVAGYREHRQLLVVPQHQFVRLNHYLGLTAGTVCQQRNTAHHLSAGAGIGTHFQGVGRAQFAIQIGKRLRHLRYRRLGSVHLAFHRLHFAGLGFGSGGEGFHLLGYSGDLAAELRTHGVDAFG